MRSVWTGNLAFGLVSIPVKLGSAVSSHKVGFRQIHLADQGRVRYQKTCELDDEVLGSAEITRAFETPDEQLVEVTDAELRALPLPTAKTIEVEGFVDTAGVDAMQLDTPYFLAPASPTADKPYVLMREALARSGKAAVGKFAMRNSEHLALITARDDILLLQTLRWPDELNPAADSAPRGKVTVSDNELRLADTLIEALGEADLSEYQDEYAAAVEALVTAKLEGVEPPTVEGETGGGQVVDLMAALQASVDRAKGGRRGGGEGKEATVTDIGRSGKGGGTAGKRAAKKAPAKKAPAKKAAAKKTAKSAKTAKTAKASKPAKKTAAKKTAGRHKAN
ncbi:MAG: Ku protein [Streptomyces sp.]|nr:Ku protein [Streptomyces sp.]